VLPLNFWLLPIVGFIVHSLTLEKKNVRYAYHGLILGVIYDPF